MNKATQVRRARLVAFAAAQVATAAGSRSPLQISALRDYRLREPVSGRTYTIIKLQTRGGLEGYGECGSVTSTELAQALKIVQGKDATQFETVRFQLKSTPSGLAAALNVAMLDVVGRSVKAPVYQVLGGPTRNKCRALAALEGATDTELTTAVRRAREAGFKAFLVPAPPTTGRNQGQAFVLATRKRLEALRQAAGPETDFALDCGGTLLPGDAASLAT